MGVAGYQRYDGRDHKICDSNDDSGPDRPEGALQRVKAGDVRHSQPENSDQSRKGIEPEPTGKYAEPDLADEKVRFAEDLKVAKQIVAMFASVCGPSLFDANPQLRKFVLDPDARGIPAHIRILCYLMSPKSTSFRQAGITGMITASTLTASSKTFAELAFPPFGYLLTFGAPEDDWGLADITFFTHHSLAEYREMHLPMITKEVHAYFPGDFRTHSEWIEAAKRRPGDDDDDDQEE